MKQVILLTTLFTVLATGATAQKYYTKNGSISFFSKTSMENIKADNNQVLSVLNAQTGEIQFSVLIKSFHFEKALMEEHFNENYVESNKFPKAEFKGSVSNNDAVNYSKDGTYTVTVKGKLTMHGVTKDVETTGKLTVTGGKIQAVASFNALLSDYSVSIPGLVADKVAKTAKIDVVCSLEPLK